MELDSRAISRMDTEFCVTIMSWPLLKSLYGMQTIFRVPQSRCFTLSRPNWPIRDPWLLQPAGPRSAIGDKKKTLGPPQTLAVAHVASLEKESTNSSVATDTNPKVTTSKPLQGPRLLDAQTYVAALSTLETFQFPEHWRLLGSASRVCRGQTCHRFTRSIGLSFLRSLDVEVILWRLHRASPQDKRHGGNCIQSTAAWQRRGGYEGLCRCLSSDEAAVAIYVGCPGSCCALLAACGELATSAEDQLHFLACRSFLGPTTRSCMVLVFGRARFFFGHVPSVPPKCEAEKHFAA